MTILTTPPAFIYNRWRTWGIFLLTMWSLMLALTAFLYAFILYRMAVTTEPAILNLLIGLNVLFGLTFSLSTYGLWRRRAWGRLSFMALMVIWSGLNLWAVVTADPPYSWPTLLWDGARHVFGFAIPLIYLNLPHIKIHFGGNE